jgi:hypothetical protein
MLRHFAQGFITTLTIPATVDGLLEWCGDELWTCGTSVDSALRLGRDVTWTSPPGVGAGDVGFFHYAAGALPRIRKLRREAGKAGILDDGMADFLHYAEEQAERLSGRVFACGVLSGPAEPSPEQTTLVTYWRSRLYAPFASVHELENPLTLREHEDALPRPHKAITELTAAAFGALKTRLADTGNVLPPEIEAAVPGRDDFGIVTASTWREAACRDGQRFAHETDVRGYLADYLLDELKDEGTTVHREARCLHTETSARRRPGAPIADYLVRLDGRWTPVEAKRSLWSWPDLLGQVDQYVHVSEYEVRVSGGRLRLPGDDTGVCLVIDQAGVYLVRDGAYVQSERGRPLWSRVELAERTGEELRGQLLVLLDEQG